MKKKLDLLINVLSFSFLPVLIDSMAKEYPLNTIFGLALSVYVFLLAFMIPILLSFVYGDKVVHSEWVWKLLIQK